MLVAYLRQHTSAYVSVYRESLVSCKVAVSISQQTSALVYLQGCGQFCRHDSPDGGDSWATGIRRWGRDVHMGESWHHQVDNVSIVDIVPPCSIRQHTSAYVSIRLYTCLRALDSACRRSTWRHSRRTTRWLRLPFSTGRERTGRSLAFHCIRQHTSAYVSIRQYTSAYVSVRDPL